MEATTSSTQVRKNHFFTPNGKAPGDATGGVTGDRSALGLDATPTDPTNNGEFPHFCPICMMHFKRILATQCCNNTICEVCTKDIIQKNSDSSPLSRMLQHGNRRHLAQDTRKRGLEITADENGIYAPMSVVPCPFCSRSVKFKRVSTGSKAVKSYKDSPAVNHRASTSATRRGSRDGSKTSSAAMLSPPPALRKLSMDSPAASNLPGAVAQPSPAKPGSEFEQLRRKVKPLGDVTNAIRALEERKHLFVKPQAKEATLPSANSARHNLPHAPSRSRSNSRGSESGRRSHSHGSRPSSQQDRRVRSALNPVPERREKSPTRCSVM